jgi:hypothetical protein
MKAMIVPLRRRLPLTTEFLIAVLDKGPACDTIVSVQASFWQAFAANISHVTGNT